MRLCAEIDDINFVFPEKQLQDVKLRAVELTARRYAKTRETCGNCSRARKRREIVRRTKSWRWRALGLKADHRPLRRFFGWGGLVQHQGRMRTRDFFSEKPECLAMTLFASCQRSECNYGRAQTGPQRDQVVGILL